MLFSLGMGVLGYHLLARINWIDSLLNASMILSGMGPVSNLHGTTAKLFASATPCTREWSIWQYPQYFCTRRLSDF